MKEIKTEWCKNWIKHTFEKRVPPGGGIETECFWRMAEKTGLWVRGTYGSPMSMALQEMCSVEIINNTAGEYLYSVFRLAVKDEIE